MNEVVYGVVAVPAIIGLVTVAKNAGLPTRFAPLLDIILGIGSAVASVYTTVAVPATPQNVVQAVVVGISLGLSAAGVYQQSGNVPSLHRNKTGDAPPETVNEPAKEQTTA
ncbi:MAG: hypothetical protein LC754_10480 [Acidobacteria bacterium]|nr:hypothetical protein [Acidobacteriota bacterium]